jgi:hypothetical protein
MEHGLNPDWVIVVDGAQFGTTEHANRWLKCCFDEGLK